MNKLKELQQKVKYLNVLLVDDEISVLESAEKFFRKFFDNVTTVQTAQEAFEIIQEDKSYDILITDLKMPVMSGTDLVKKVKNEFQNKNIFIAIISGTTKDELEAVTLADFYIQKPVGIANIVAMLDQLIVYRKQN